MIFIYVMQTLRTRLIQRCAPFIAITFIYLERLRKNATLIDRRKLRFPNIGSLYLKKSAPEEN